MTRASISTLVIGAALIGGCRGQAKDREPPQNVDVSKDTMKPMQHTDDMQAVRNDSIQFATSRRRGATLPTLDRQVVLTGPPEAVAIAERGEVAVLDQLVPLLADRDRAWAAEVMLAAMTGREADIVNSFQARPSSFFDEVGQGAKDRWQRWLDEVRGKLQWDAAQKQFTLRE
jgi:hypothetical protein